MRKPFFVVARMTFIGLGWHALCLVHSQGSPFANIHEFVSSADVAPGVSSGMRGNAWKVPFSLKSLKALARLCLLLNPRNTFSPLNSGVGLLTGNEQDIHSTMKQIAHAHKEQVKTALERHAPTIFDGLSSQGYAVVDNFLPAENILAMRAEAAQLHGSGRTCPSLTEVCYEDGSVDVIEKPGVFSYEQLLQEDIEPGLFGFTNALKEYIPTLFKTRFPDVPLSNYLYANKLTVTTGEGSENPLHLDQCGESDSRKLTMILYLQSNWTAQQGGCFRMFEAVEPNVDLETVDMGAHVDIAPLGGRLLTFWADRMPHSVRPTYASSEESHRWAFTTWFPHDNPFFQIERVEEEWSMLYNELEAQLQHLPEPKRERAVDAAFVERFGCTCEEKIERIRREHKLEAG